MANEEKTHIRICLQGEDGNFIRYNREDSEHETTIDTGGFEDLYLKEDSTKINLYLNSEFIYLSNNKTYKVIERTFMPCRPVCLYLKLKEV